MNRHSGRLWAISALTLVASLTACGDDEQTASIASTDPTESSESTEPTEPTESSDPTDSTDSTEVSGGSEDGDGSGARSGETIDVGLVNNEGGAFSLPEFRIGAEAAAKWINEHGGIDGATLNLHICLAEPSPEGSINCANKFVDDGVDVVYAGIDIAADASLPILSDAGIPWVSSNSWGTRTKTDPNVHVLGTAGVAYYAGPFSYFAEQGASTFVAVLEDTPVGRQVISDTVEPMVEALGIEVTSVFVDPVNPDWASAVATAMDSNPDVIYGQLSEPACIGLQGATKDLGYEGVVVLGSCTAFLQVLGEKAVGAYAVGDGWGPDAIASAPPDIKEDLELYIEAMTDAGQEEHINGFATISFSKVVDLAAILATIPAETPIDPGSISAALSSAADIEGFASGPLDCTGVNDWPGETTACRSLLLMYQVEQGEAGPVRVPVFDEMRDFSDVAAELGS